MKAFTRINIAALLAAFFGWAQPASSAEATALTSVESVIDEDPLPSVRAQGMGHALTTVADEADAAMHNPAGIGGLGPVKEGASSPWIRKLYFPLLSAGANTSAKSLLGELRSNGASQDSVIGKAAVESRANTRQYARVTAATGLVIKRLMILPFQDFQIAAVPRASGDSTVIDTRYRSMTGLGYGLSGQDSRGRISLGYFGYYARRQEVTGPLSYEDLMDTGRRNSAIRTYANEYTGRSDNVGLIWRFSPWWNPSLGVATKNLGNSTFRNSGGGLDLVIPQQTSVAVSASPKLGKESRANFVLKFDQLENKSLAPNEKYHIGSELLVGGLGSYATLGLRAGFTHMGASGGLSVNMGLISVEASSYFVDLAATSGARAAEQRLGATVYVNVAEF